jgi:myo-inositol catabolism protein IolS
MSAPGPPRTRRSVITALGLGLLAGGGSLTYAWRRLARTAYAADAALPVRHPDIVELVGAMPYRAFGRTGLKVSEIGFGSWAIGGTAYGAVERQESLRALARAEELGCNLVDTAMIYGDAELVLGEFLRGRRNRWIIATKYSFQGAGLAATVEAQLKRLGTDFIDFYQLHWVPRDLQLYEDLYRLKEQGKVRSIGVSVSSAGDIDAVLNHAQVDGLQLPFSLLDPDPFLARAARLRASGVAVLVRSSLREGFLAGTLRRDAKFPDPQDQRHSWSPQTIAATVDAVERFRFLEADAGSMVRAAVAYPLSYPEVSTVLLGVKNAAQAGTDFGQIPGARLTSADLQRVLAVQDEIDAGQRRTLRALARRALGRS